jgi:hypothetical protein
VSLTKRLKGDWLRYCEPVLIVSGDDSIALQASQFC